MNSRYGMAVWIMLIPIGALAQIRGVIVNMETGVPLRDIVVFTDKEETTTTHWDGTFELRDTTFNQLQLGHHNYEKRVMLRHELTDTIALIPAYNALNEVEVIGHSRWKDKAAAFQVPMAELKMLDQMSGKAGFSVGEMKRLRKKKRLKELKRLLENY